jgi:CDP-diacylglycerol--glycerol-3-phosphate 3-phosphatidyltransferase
MDLRKQLPNFLSGLRIALVPVLLWLAWAGHPTAFLVSFAFSLSTDLLDGYLARRMRSGSDLGAKLDSWGDLATYSVFPLCAWWLFRERVIAQLPFVVAALIAFVAPMSIGLVKFRRITSYHTRLAKAVAIVMGAGLILYLGFDVPALFQVAVLLLLVEALEEIAITAVLAEWRANVPSLFAALRIARGAKPAAVLALALLGAPGAVSAQAQLPDLVPEVSDVQVEFQATVASGDVAEGCALATTGRDLVRLSLTTRNDGPGAVDIGDPMCPLPCSAHPNETCGNPDFICSPAGGHNHPHYQNFLRYEILDPNGAVAATGGKRSFCLAESQCLDGTSFHHDCDDQGLDPDCWDIYPYYLGCQYVDVTDLPDELYTLRVTVDPQQKFAEANENNNVIEQPILILRGPLTDASLEAGALLLKAAHVFRMRARSGEPLLLSSGKSDPTRAGGTLYVSDTVAGDEIGFGLPASGWKRVGKASDPRAYRYRGSDREDGACSFVKISRGSLQARCNLRGEHTHFDLPAQGNVFVQLLLGAADRRFCASFGGATLRNDAVLVRRRGAAPTNGCDTGN